MRFELKALVEEDIEDLGPDHTARMVIRFFWVWGQLVYHRGIWPDYDRVAIGFAFDGVRG